jgi:hypothetical protein
MLHLPIQKWTLYPKNGVFAVQNWELNMNMRTYQDIRTEASQNEDFTVSKTGHKNEA